MLVRSKELKGKPFPIIGSLAKSSKYYLIIAVVFGGYSYFVWNMGMLLISGAAIGIIVGIIIRDITWFRVNSKLWSINNQIINWEKVDNLLEEDET